VNQDRTINSGQNPAPAGSVVSLFVTGLGTVTPPPPDGSITSYPLPSQDLKAIVAFFWNGIDPSGFFETDANVPYVGPAPLELEGVGQINVVVPPAPPPGLVIGGPFIYIEVSLPNGGRVSSSGVALWTK
jgi:uncharacterized protein (TIGR03437 family)